MTRQKPTILDLPTEGPSLLDIFAAADDKDPISFVVRMHLQIERELDYFIAAALPNPNELGRLDYFVRIRLALACGLRSDLKNSLSAVGALRNKFAHRLSAQLTDDEINRLVEAMPEYIQLGFAEQYPAGHERSPQVHKLFYCLLMLVTALSKETDRLLGRGKNEGSHLDK